MPCQQLLLNHFSLFPIVNNPRVSQKKANSNQELRHEATHPASHIIIILSWFWDSSNRWLSGFTSNECLAYPLPMNHKNQPTPWLTSYPFSAKSLRIPPSWYVVFFCAYAAGYLVAHVPPLSPSFRPRAPCRWPIEVSHCRPTTTMEGLLCVRLPRARLDALPKIWEATGDYKCYLSQSHYVSAPAIGYWFKAHHIQGHLRLGEPFLYRLHETEGRSIFNKVC